MLPFPPLRLRSSVDVDADVNCERCDVCAGLVLEGGGGGGGGRRGLWLRASRIECLVWCEGVGTRDLPACADTVFRGKGRGMEGRLRAKLDVGFGCPELVAAPLGVFEGPMIVS